MWYCSKILHIYRNGRKSDKWCFIWRNLLPSISSRKEWQSRQATNFMATHWRASKGESTWVFTSVRISPWKSHIQQATTKASRSVGFLRRNLRGCPSDVEAKAYTTLVRPVLEYESSVLDQYTIQQINALERVQRQAARFVTADYFSRNPGCVTNMLCTPTCMGHFSGKQD